MKTHIFYFIIFGVCCDCTFLSGTLISVNLSARIESLSLSSPFTANAVWILLGRCCRQKFTKYRQTIVSKQDRAKQNTVFLIIKSELFQLCALFWLTVFQKFTANFVWEFEMASQCVKKKLNYYQKKEFLCLKSWIKSYTSSFHYVFSLSWIPSQFAYKSKIIFWLEKVCILAFRARITDSWSRDIFLNNEGTL